MRCKMKPEDKVTSPGLSKRLVENGIVIETERTWCIGEDHNWLSDLSPKAEKHIAKINNKYHTLDKLKNAYPAPDIHELLQVLPRDIKGHWLLINTWLEDYQVSYYDDGIWRPDWLYSTRNESLPNALAELILHPEVIEHVKGGMKDEATVKK